MGEASMCWDNINGAGTFQLERAIEIGEALRQHFADGIGDFATARRRVCDDMANDPGLRICYQSNIAMMIMDNSPLSYRGSNDLADKLMELLFEA